MKTRSDMKSISELRAKWTHACIPAAIAIVIGTAVPSFGNTEGDQAPATAQEQEERAVKPGDGVKVDYLCRLRNGEVAASAGTVTETEKKSVIFVPPKENGPAFVVAVKSDEPFPEQLWPGPFETEIRMRLARQVTGMKEGGNRQVELSAQMIPPKNEQEGFAWLSRVRTRPKETKMPKGDYEFRARKAPEVGQSFFFDPAFPGKVESVTDTDVVIRFSAKPGDVIETPFGRGHIREEGENYKVDIDAREGTLVRTGHKIGRITKVDEKVITIDYRHPFGYEELVCDLTVISISEIDSEYPGKGVQ